jgi:hypothetical protein
MNLIVEKNRGVSIKSLHQWQTYGGLLEGLPTDRMNLRILENTRDYAKKYCGQFHTYMIEPVQTPIKYEGEYAFGNPMSLPPVTCIAELSHFQPIKDTSCHGSILILIWFQDEFAFPIAPNILDEIKNLHWSQLAQDILY